MGASVSNSSTPATATNMKDFVNTEVSANDVVIFSKSYCPYCMATKKLFQNSEFKGVSVAVHELDRRADGDSIQATLLDLTGQRTVPSVWVKGTFLGGNSDTQSAYGSGQLKTMLGL